MLRQKVKELEPDKQDLDVMLEMATEHADDLEAQSQFGGNTFGRYVSEDVVAQLLDDPEGPELGGRQESSDHHGVGLARYTTVGLWRMIAVTLRRAVSQLR